MLGARAAGAPVAQEKVQAYFHHGFWQPMDTLRDKQQLEELWATGGALEDMVKSVGGMSGFSHRAHGVQGGLAGAVAGEARRAGPRLRAGSGDQPEHVLSWRAWARLSRTCAATFWISRGCVTGWRVRSAGCVPSCRPASGTAFVCGSAGHLRGQRDGDAHVLEAVREVSGIGRWSLLPRTSAMRTGNGSGPTAKQIPSADTIPIHPARLRGVGGGGIPQLLFCFVRVAGPPVGLATARAGNVIGGGDWSEDRLVPDLIRGFLSGEPVRIRRPQAIRPWQHVLEPLRGYLQLAERLLAGDTEFAAGFNFGPREDDAWSVERIATKLADRWGGGARWISDTDPGVHEAAYLRLDSSKARTRLQWHPRLTIEPALEWTAEWYGAFARGADMQAFTMQQIAAYERL